MRTLRLLISIIFVIACAPLFAQADPDAKDKTNPLYEPVSVVQRLSYDNFKNIKLLMTAVYNFGGGEAEFNKLVDGYAEASALYFSRDFEKAAVSFSKNEKDIRESAMKLAEKYKKDAETLNKEIIAYNVKIRVKQSIDGKKPTDGMLTADKLIEQGAESLSKANDAYVRVRPAQAIGLYRRSKDNSINFWHVLDIKEYNGQNLAERFAKDSADNKNKMYVAKEKKN
jgi:hypothetical protein